MPKSHRPLRGETSRTPASASGGSASLDRRQFLGGGLGAVTLFSLGWPLGGCQLKTDSGSGTDGDYAASGRPLVAEGQGSGVPLIWVEAGVCTGCSCSLLASAEPPIESVLPSLRLEFQETLMDRSGPGSIDYLLDLRTQLSGQYLLIVDGNIPAAPLDQMLIVGRSSAGQDYSAERLVSELAANAAATLALGTCAAFGGVGAAKPNPTNSKPLSYFVPAGKPLIHVPGCPPHPGWILQTLTQVLNTGIGSLSLDNLKRPLPIFGQTVHDHCPRKAAFDAGQFATSPGDPKLCLYSVGCRGPQTFADCPSRSWNGSSFCINANHPCIGCASPGFPDEPEGTDPTITPFYYDG